MSNTVIYILLAVVFGLLCFFIWEFMKGSAVKAPVKVAEIKAPTAAGEKIQVEVKPTETGVDIFVYNSYKDRPSDAVMFPEIEDDLMPPKGTLGRDFWDKVAHIGDIEDPAEREGIVRTLADKGFIPEEAVSSWIMPAPDAGGEDGDGEDDREEAEEEYVSLEFPDEDEGYYFDI